MKKILLIITFCLLWSIQAFAAGTITEDQTAGYTGINMRWKTYTCTADDADASYPITAITGFKGYMLTEIETWSGVTSPTDASDFTLLDYDKYASGVSDDLMGGNGTDGIDATDPKRLTPAIISEDNGVPSPIKGDMYLVITNNAVNGAVFYFRITGMR